MTTDIFKKKECQKCQTPTFCEVSQRNGQCHIDNGKSTMVEVLMWACQANKQYMFYLWVVHVLLIVCANMTQTQLSYSLSDVIAQKFPTNFLPNLVRVHKEEGSWRVLPLHPPGLPTGLAGKFKLLLHMVVMLKQTNLLWLVNHPDATLEVTLEVENPYNLTCKNTSQWWCKQAKMWTIKLRAL
jgi:hypothetical protein